MANQAFVIAIGLCFAGLGHVLVHDLLGAAAAWSRADERFPPPLRSSPSFAGAALLAVGALLVLIPIAG